VTFDVAFDRVIGVEQGYVNDPSDPGGETNFGVSRRSYPDVDIKALTREGAKAIYRRDFWDVLAADQLPDAVVFEAMDFAVHSGPGTAVRYLQRAVGVADDGEWGTESRKAAAAMSPSDVLFLFLAERLDYMTRCKNWPSAGRGWARRIAQQMRYGALDT